MTNNIVPTLSALYALKNHTEGELFYCEENSKIYMWQDDKGHETNIENKGVSMNLYALNKNIINQLPTMDNTDIINKFDLFDELRAAAGNKHYMMLCKDFNYYTIFASDAPNAELSGFSATIAEIIDEIGEVKSIEFTEDKSAIEIWIVPNESEDAYVFYLFPYDAGVVYFG